jgi:hypothetical protein
MAHYDVFNGDADGLCALQQLRLADPKESHLVTGIKRDIKLLARVDAGEGDSLTVLDISLDKNREPLDSLLGRGVQVEYFDHHYAGDIPEHPLLKAHIDLSPETCTSLIVDEYLAGRYRAWAVVGAFGDNFFDSARHAAQALNASEADLKSFEALGTYLNYNGYGAAVEDLFFPPDELFRRIRPYADPLEFVASDPAYGTLRDGYEGDMAKARELAPEVSDDNTALFRLPDAPWARRVGGVLGNQLARDFPGRAHALLTPKADGSFVVSVRAPLSNRQGADELCRQFATGGGRQAAAGINALPEDDVARFIDKFREQF